ncbi:MAG: cyclic nucleotide-binding protein [Parvularcula sp.]|nr:cyclic nucleotide-binding protein [Parvularcula sp.]
MAEATARAANGLLNALTEDSWRAIEPYLEKHDLQHRDYISRADERIEHLYFIESGWLSILAPGPAGLESEIGLLGREGMSGFPILMGVDGCPFETFVQQEGSAYRIAAGDMRDILKKDEDVRTTLLKFAYVMHVQSAFTAMANAHGKLEERLARWLLMCHDRVGGDEMPLVHEFLALMLAVRRPGVTDALHIIEGKGLIKARRGQITVLDREGLIEHAAGFYGQPEKTYAGLFGAAA